MRIIGQFIRNIGNLCLNTAASIGIKFCGLTHIIFGFVLGDTFKNFIAKIQALPFWVTALKLGHYTITLMIVIKAAMFAHQMIENIFARMTKRWMPQIMGKANCLG